MRPSISNTPVIRPHYMSVALLMTMISSYQQFSILKSPISLLDVREIMGLRAGRTSFNIRIAPPPLRGRVPFFLRVAYGKPIRTGRLSSLLLNGSARASASLKNAPSRVAGAGALPPHPSVRLGSLPLLAHGHGCGSPRVFLRTVGGAGQTDYGLNGLAPLPNNRGAAPSSKCGCLSY